MERFFQELKLMDVETQTESSYAMMLVVCCFVHEFLNAKAGLQHHDRVLSKKNASHVH